MSSNKKKKDSKVEKTSKTGSNQPRRRSRNKENEATNVKVCGTVFDYCHVQYSVEINVLLCVGNKR